jgi:L-asparaginase
MSSTKSTREQPVVQIFSCGGTIDKVYFDANSEYEVGEPQIAAIFRQANVGFTFVIESLFRKDSLEMTDADRQDIRDRVAACPSQRILITHGTDTMPESAAALLGVEGKTIVLTGSMTPARFSASDAEFNIGCAVGALYSQSPGVYVAMNGCVFEAGKVRKNREAGRFERLV